MLNQLISADRFLVYVDYFTIAAQAGLQSAEALVNAINYSQNINLETLGVATVADAAQSALSQTLVTSYKQILISAQSTIAMSDAFRALIDHIKTFTGDTLNAYLTSNGIKVTSTFADLCRIFGEIIDSSNIN